MTGEIQNILKGTVNTTVEYDTSRKVIGVSTTNLIPGANGVVPLAKQGAFQVQEKNESVETVDFVQAISNVQRTDDTITNATDLPMLDQQTIKTPEHSDVISENPVQIANPSEMNSFAIPNIEIQTPAAPVEETPVAVDMEMPIIEEKVVADEPTELNGAIFEGNAESNPMLDNNTPVESAPVTTNIESSSPTSVEEATTPEFVAPETTPSVVIETPVIDQTATIPEETPTVNIQLPIIEPKQEENIVETVPTTTPDTTIPSFNIEMPVIDATSTTSEKPSEDVLIEENAAQTNQLPEEQTSGAVGLSAEISPVEQTTTETSVEDTQTPPVESAARSGTESTGTAEENTNELPQEVIPSKTPTNESNEQIKDIIHQHKIIIENCAEAISKITDELKKAAKSLEELELKTAEITTTKESTKAQVEEIVNSVNPLVNEAFDRINAIAAPRL